ncbi:hypothetical protein TRFO_05600 [Tritrichomonas foetus]|uniref:Myb-like DNA-binding domain containing protein n=1 Tax=Tritrichomonas foetus TaxID=1144522 RepID=A0A1J4K4S9_9EUKA|nr:hypothetical protein TRFO_05600 [Tritrichomonas foetus]|eukprot:OHT06399.1 hypothetical protein TRFO_05600 [Tritrichomonas foetus]
MARSSTWNIELPDDIQSMGLDHLSKVCSCRRRVFSTEEDKFLADLVISKECTNWFEVAQRLPGRTPRQCRDRWTNYLCPTNTFAPWTPEEDQLVIDKVNEVGTRWATIAKMIQGRSDNCIKNRWYSGLKAQCAVDSRGKYYIRAKIAKKRLDAANEKKKAEKALKNKIELKTITEHQNHFQNIQCSQPPQQNQTHQNVQQPSQQQTQQQYQQSISLPQFPLMIQQQLNMQSYIPSHYIQQQQQQQQQQQFQQYEQSSRFQQFPNLPQLQYNQPFVIQPHITNNNNATPYQQEQQQQYLIHQNPSSINWDKGEVNSRGRFNFSIPDLEKEINIPLMPAFVKAVQEATEEEEEDTINDDEYWDKQLYHQVMEMNQDPFTAAPDLFGEWY